MEKRTVYTVDKSEIKILHTGDTHLGARQYHSDVRRRDFFDSFDKVVSDAIENEMDAVIHTGDLFDNRNPTIEDLIDTIAILTRLKKAGIPFLGIVGNHETKQNTQWLDIFQTMGLAKRLGEHPVIIEGSRSQIRFYGIDNLSGPRLAAFDFSIFDAEQKHGGDGKKIYNLLALHQLLEPILPGQPLSCDDFTNPVPIQFDAVLLGDNHKYECVKHNGFWLTYSGSTERCSAAEVEPRAYNILTFDGAEISMTRRTIPTRDFVKILVESNEKGEILIEEVYAKIDAYAEKIVGAVVFVEFSGIKKTLIPISEIEDYVKNKGAVVSRVGDKRDLEKSETDKVKQIVFRDPDEAVTQELKRLNLTEAGFLIDSIIRDADTSKTNVADASENQLKIYLDGREFKEEFRRESPYLYDADLESDENEVTIAIETYAEINRAAADEAAADERVNIDDEMADNEMVVVCEMAAADEIVAAGEVAVAGGRADIGGLADVEISDAAEVAVDEIESEIVLTAPASLPKKAKELKKAKPHNKPRQYTLGDMFGSEDEK